VDKIRVTTKIEVEVSFNLLPDHHVVCFLPGDCFDTEDGIDGECKMNDNYHLLQEAMDGYDNRKWTSADIVIEDVILNDAVIVVMEKNQ